MKTAPVPPRYEAEGRDDSFASTRLTSVIETSDSATASAQALKALSELCRSAGAPFTHSYAGKDMAMENARFDQSGFHRLIRSRLRARALRKTTVSFVSVAGAEAFHPRQSR